MKPCFEFQCVFLLNLIVNFIKTRRCLPQYAFEMPLEISNSFYLANTTIYDNLVWYYYYAMEQCYKKLVDQLGQRPGMNLGKAKKGVYNFIMDTLYNRKILEMHFPVLQKNGKIRMVEGYAIEHGIHPMHLGGGNLQKTLESYPVVWDSTYVLLCIRFDPNLVKDDVAALATMSTFRNAIVDIPLDGTFCGIKIDPKTVDESIITQVIQQCVAQLMKKNFIGAKYGIFMPELKTNTKTMDLMVDEYFKHLGREDYSNICICGKSENKNGLKDYDKSVCEGICKILTRIFNNELLMKQFKLRPGFRNKKFMVKGFGKMGMNLASMFDSLQANCIGVLDSDNLAYYNKNGLELQKLRDYKEQHGTIDGFGIRTNYKEVLESDCDIILVTSVLKAITAFNAACLKTKIIIEVTNGGIVPVAHKVLLAKGVLIIPDILINTAQSLVSYLEYTQNLKSEILSTKEMTSGSVIPFSFGDKIIERKIYPSVENRLIGMTEKIITILEDDKFENIDLRTLSYIYAMENLLRTTFKSNN